MSFLRSTSRAGAVLDPASSLSVVVCSGVSTSAARLDFLAIVTSIKSCERNEAIIAYLVTVLMERTTRLVELYVHCGGPHAIGRFPPPPAFDHVQSVGRRRYRVRKQHGQARHHRGRRRPGSGCRSRARPA